MEKQSEKVNYQLPQSSLTQNFKFNDFSYDLAGCDSPQPASWTRVKILPEDDNNCTLTFTLEGVNQDILHGSENIIPVALFREGIEVPIQSEVAHYHGSKCCVSFSLAGIEPGEYFIYISQAEPSRNADFFGYQYMKGGIAFPIRLLKNGIHYRFPEIDSIHIFCFAAIRVNFKTPFDTEKSWLHYACCNLEDKTVTTSDWLEMPSDGMFVNMGKRPAVPFEQGDYLLKLYLNNAEKARFRFSIKDSEITNLVQEPI